MPGSGWNTANTVVHGIFKPLGSNPQNIYFNLVLPMEQRCGNLCRSPHAQKLPHAMPSHAKPPLPKTTGLKRMGKAGLSGVAKVAPNAGELTPHARDVNRFLQRVGDELDTLSLVLQQIARYVESHRDQLALLRVQDIARNADVQPSAVVRFAKHFGFSGYSAMRALFRADMSAQITFNKNYQVRIRELVQHSDHRLTPGEITQSYIGAAVEGMQALQKQMAHANDMAAAVELLAHAAGIWVAGTNRAFPVASYLAYALQQTDKPVHWVAAIGAMHSAELRALRAQDVLIAISFAPYGKETLAAIDTAVQRGARVLAFTDTHLSPLAKKADVSLVIPESSVSGFRSLTNTLVVAQSLFVALAYRLELQARGDGAMALV
jgi:DNA-binding MurR/RpiR family transcriptional regulator